MAPKNAVEAVWALCVVNRIFVQRGARFSVSYCETVKPIKDCDCDLGLYTDA